MKHGIKGRKLNRTSSHRVSLLHNLSRSLAKHELIKTTLPKAKELRPFFEKLITISKKDSLSNRRFLMSVLNEKALVCRFFDDFAVRLRNRSGGYTRVVRCGFRSGDMAPMAIIELVQRSGFDSQSSKSE